MTKKQELIARIDAAIERIKLIADGSVEVEHEGEALPLVRKVRRLKRDRDTMAHELEQLRKKRDKDVAEIDALVTQLKPLIGEA